MNNKVLLVDDEPLALQALHRVLGHHLALSFATSGPDALALLENEGPFAVVVCDIRMPGMGGIEVLREMRRRAPETVRLALSGHADFEAAITAVNEGAIFRFHTKPVAPAILEASIDSALVRHQHERGARGLTDPTDDLLKDVSELRSGIAQGELRFYFQPQRRLADDKVVGAEALVRWQHPSRGLLLPGDFLGIAEAAGLLEQITALALSSACAEARQWMDLGHDSLRVAVNITAADLGDSNFSSRIGNLLTEYGLPPEKLELELVEGHALDDVSVTRTNLREIARLGVALSIDDFGTGYSSFGYLKDLPVSRLKIDRSFVRHLPDYAQAESIVQTIISLARTLNLSTTAEGVETEGQLAQLRQIGCDDAQGFLIARPMPAEAFRAWLKAR